METNIKTPKYPKLEGVLASRGISYSELGKAIPVDNKNGYMSDQAIRRRMNGETDFTLDEIVSVCKFLDCDFSDIIDE